MQNVVALISSFRIEGNSPCDRVVDYETGQGRTVSQRDLKVQTPFVLLAILSQELAGVGIFYGVKHLFVCLILFKAKWLMRWDSSISEQVFQDVGADVGSYDREA